MRPSKTKIICCQIYVVLYLLFLPIFIAYPAMSQDNNTRRDTFYLKKNGSLGQEYLKNHNEGMQKIILYADSIYDYEATSHGTMYTFSSGRYHFGKDSVIYFECNKNMSDELFLRNKRKRPKNLYINVCLSSYSFCFFGKNRGILVNRKR